VLDGKFSWCTDTSFVFPTSFSFRTVLLNLAIVAPMEKMEKSHVN